jgi:hypothetical protein
MVLPQQPACKSQDKKADKKKIMNYCDQNKRQSMDAGNNIMRSRLEGKGRQMKQVQANSSMIRKKELIEKIPHSFQHRL